MIFLLIGLLAGDACHRTIDRAAVKTHAVPYSLSSVHQTAYVDPYYTYVIGDDLRERLDRLEEIAERQQDLVEQQAQIIEKFRAGSAGPVAAAESPALAVIRQNCAKCHSGEGGKGGFSLDQPLDQGLKLLIADAVSSGRMPPEPAEPLSDADASLIDAWSKEDKESLRDFLRQMRRTPAK